MDNFTHSLAGWALGQTGLKRKSRKGLAALILGANAPDIDVFFGWVAWQPLATHRGVTHSLVAGLWVMPVLTAGMLWLIDRWQVSRGAEFKSGLKMRPGWLLFLAFLGCLTHPLLDWQTTYSVQLLSPFSNLWFHNDSLFIIDVWLWTGLTFAIWLSRRREASGRGNWRMPAVAAVAGTLAYIGGNAVLSTMVRSRLADDRPDVVYTSPPPVLFWHREIAMEKAGELVWADYSPSGGIGPYVGPVANNMDLPLVRRALLAPEARTFARWSTMPFAAVSPGKCRTTVQFGDARYGRTAQGGRLGTVVTLPVRGPGCP
ncbi:metal-dependent hydrolase [Tsuneonella sp. HG222]